MKTLIIKDFKVKPKNFHNIYDDGTRTFSVYFNPRKWGISIQVSYGISIHFLCFELNYLE